jgi:hypothetical protein
MKTPALTPFEKMKSTRSIAGRIPLVLLWILGVPFPILLIIFLMRGCT